MEKEKVITSEKYWYRLFELGIVLKGINGLWETASGFFILFVSKIALTNWFYLLARKELLEDPHDLFINFLARALGNLSLQAQAFAAYYVLIHGLLNIFLSIQLYRDKHWAYLVTISSMSVFVVYQIYRIILYHSLMLTILTVFDILFIALACREYIYHRDRKSATENSDK